LGKISLLICVAYVGDMLFSKFELKFLLPDVKDLDLEREKVFKELVVFPLQLEKMNLESLKI
jgi:hypothetical protein